MIKKYLFLSQMLLLLSFCSLRAQDLIVTNDTDFFVEIKQENVFSCKEIIYTIKPYAQSCVIRVKKNKPIKMIIMTYEGASNDDGCALTFENISYIKEFFISKRRQGRGVLKVVVTSNSFLVGGEIFLEQFKELTGWEKNFYEVVNVIRSFLPQEDFTVRIVDLTEKEIEYTQSQFQKLDLKNLPASETACCSPIDIFPWFLFLVDDKAE